MVNSPKNCRKKALVLATALVLLPLWGSAAGLGRITVQSGLGQPLRAELEVTATRDEVTSLIAKIASADAFRIAGIDYQPALASVQFSKEVKERNGRRFIEVVSDKPMSEPFVDMLIELSWSSGRLVREYTFLLDPPELVKPPPTVAVSPDLKTVERAPIMIPAMSAGKSVADTPSLAGGRPVSPPSGAGQSSASSGEATRLVVPGDTLGRIAAQTRPEGISLDQMLVALFRSNKDAFSADNMNRLKAGKILSIPSAEEALKVEKVEARREIVAQAADFNVYRSKLAALTRTVPAVQSTADQTSSGKITPKVTDNAPKPIAGDKLEVSKTEGGKSASPNVQPLQGRLTSLEEDLVSRDRALREANSRIGDLEKNLNDLKKLAELKSQAGAAVQKQAEAAKSDPAKLAADVVGEKPAAPPGGGSPAPTGEAVKDAVNEPQKKPEAMPSDTAKPVEKTKVAAPPPPEPEPDLLSDTDFLMKLGAGIALLLGIVGVSVARRKRKAVVREEPMTQSSLSANSVFSDTAKVGDSNISNVPSTDYSVSEAATTGADEPLDPIVEADTFLAFGRDAQAEERLLEGLAADPGRHAIHVKLLEIYAGRRSTLQFNTLAQDLRDQTGGSGPAWERAVVIGQSLDPSNPLYQTASAAPAAEVNPDATMIFSAPVSATVAEVVAVDAPSASGLDFDLGLDEDHAAPEAATAKTEGVSIDFDLDLGADTPAPAKSVSSGALDVDFELDAPSDSSPKPSVVAPIAADSSDISFDLEMPKVATPVAVAMDVDLALPDARVPANAAPNESSVDFEFDLGTPKLDAPALSAKNPAAPLDLEGISLELDPPSRAQASTTGVGADGDNPEVATKLELAVAYEEMGDRDGARELLAEVLREGSATQQAAAKARLDQLV